MGKIGQLTFHGAHNYGSVLQAYALSRQLQILGHETEIINLRPQSQKDTYKIIRKGDRGIHKVFRYMIYPFLKKRYDNYERFINQVLPISKESYNSTKELEGTALNYDAYVCGGDQIWNPACQDFETAYYLQFLPENHKARKISYAPSLGKTEFDEATKQNFAQWLKIFDAVSVREKCGAELLQAFTDKPVHTVCDPVLLLEKEEWGKIAVKPRYKKPYILVYFLENNHGSRDLTEYLKKTLGYEVVIFNEYIRDFVKPYHKAYSASPEEFVGLFANASFVYTNSFHGTVFATIFEKPFISAIAAEQENAVNNNDSRKIDYLKKIGLEERLYTADKPNQQFLLDIDYSLPGKKIEEFREESLLYLKDELRDVFEDGKNK